VPPLDDRHSGRSYVARLHWQRSAIYARAVTPPSRPRRRRTTFSRA
jgi:hypothetical protein